MEEGLLTAHAHCKKEATNHLEKNKVDVVDQVQFYQGCVSSSHLKASLSFFLNSLSLT